jgi:hypothetical protein
MSAPSSSQTWITTISGTSTVTIRIASPELPV